MKNIYVCSTLKNKWNLNYNQALANALLSQDIQVYLPQRDTDQSASRGEILSQNMAAMGRSTLMIAVGKNASPNWGAEVGFFYGSGKRVIILAETADEVPLMSQGMNHGLILVPSLEDLESYLGELIAKLADLKKFT